MATTTTVSNSMITDPTALAASIASSGWNDWSQNLAPYLQARMIDGTNTANSLAGNTWSTASADRNQATSMVGDYNNIYRPAGQNLSNQVNKYGTEAYQDAQAGKAGADVQQQIDSQQGQMQRQMQRQGVNPASGRMMAMQNQNAIAGAAAKAGAMNQARDAADARYTSGLKDLSSMGLDTVKASDIMNQSGQKWAGLGLDATKAGVGFGMAYGDLASGTTYRAGNVASSAANAANQTAQTASNIQSLKDSNSIPNLITAGLVKAGSTYLNGAVGSGMSALSDWAKSKLTPTPTGPVADDPESDGSTADDGGVGGNYDSGSLTGVVGDLNGSDEPFEWPVSDASQDTNLYGAPEDEYIDWGANL